MPSDEPDRPSRGSGGPHVHCLLDLVVPEPTLLTATVSVSRTNEQSSMCRQVPRRVVLERVRQPSQQKYTRRPVVVDVRRLLDRRDGHAAHGSIAVARLLHGRHDAHRHRLLAHGARRRSARGSRARSPRGCARRCRGRPASPAPRGAPSPRPRRAARRRPPRRARGWPPGRRRAGRPRGRGAARQLVAPVRGDDQREVVVGRLDVGAGHGRPRRGRARRPSRASAPAIGVSPTTSTRGEASIGSRKISSEPPDRHGFCTVTAPLGRRRVVVAGQDAQQQRLAGLQRAQRVQAHALLGARAADEALDRPVAEHERGVARAHARRALRAHHGRHDERRRARRAARRRDG